jgi:NADH-quinone oxidoreductase subunit E
MDKVAEIIQVLPIEVYEVVSLHYVQSKPVGKYLFEFCQTPCCLNGTEDLMDYTCEN